MTITQSEFLRAARQQAGPAREKVAELRAVERLGLTAGAVTGTPEWDTFAEIVAAMIAKADARRAAAAQAALDPRAGADQTTLQKFAVAREDAILLTLRTVLDMPKAIRDDAERARRMIDQLEPVDEPDAA